MGDPAFVVSLESVTVKDSLSYEDVPFEILDRHIRWFRNKEVISIKVLWRSQSLEGDTWEAISSTNAKYPHPSPCDPTPT